jgi:hypothetical protein
MQVPIFWAVRSAELRFPVGSILLSFNGLSTIFKLSFDVFPFREFEDMLSKPTR